MRRDDPLGEAAALARAAAEAGMEWRAPLHDLWVPELVQRYPEAVLRQALVEAGERPPELGDSVADAVEAAVSAMVAGAGYG